MRFTVSRHHKKIPWQKWCRGSKISPKSTIVKISIIFLIVIMQNINVVKAGFICFDISKERTDSKINGKNSQNILGNKYIIFDHLQKKCQDDNTCDLQIWSIQESKQIYLFSVKGKGIFFTDNVLWSEAMGDNSEVSTIYHFLTSENTVTTVKLSSKTNKIDLWINSSNYHRVCQ